MSIGFYGFLVATPIFLVLWYCIWYRKMRKNSQNARVRGQGEKLDGDELKGLRHLARKLHDKRLKKISRKKVLK